MTPLEDFLKRVEYVARQRLEAYHPNLFKKVFTCDISLTNRTVDFFGVKKKHLKRFTLTEHGNVVEAKIKGKVNGR